MCHMSCVTCQVSHVKCYFFLSFLSSFFTKWWSYLVEGMLSIGPTPSSLNVVCDNKMLIIINIIYLFCQPTTFTNLNHEARFKLIFGLLLTLASSICGVSQLAFYINNKGTINCYYPRVLCYWIKVLYKPNIKKTQEI